MFISWMKTSGHGLMHLLRLSMITHLAMKIATLITTRLMNWWLAARQMMPPHPPMWLMLWHWVVIVSF